jgi:hypothetical protein
MNNLCKQMQPYIGTHQAAALFVYVKRRMHTHLKQEKIGQGIQPAAALLLLYSSITSSLVLSLGPLSPHSCSECVCVTTNTID